jgi:polyisoprenoid-binding protein YceI
MALSPGTHNLGPDSGTMEVHTYREGLGKKVGHDLIIEVEQWEATVEVAPDGAPSAVTLEADARSLQIREGLHGVKPLSDKDRSEIRKNIDEKILGGQPISFRSSSVEGGEGRLTVQGELTIAGMTRPATFELDLAGDGRVSCTLPVIQSEFGIKPYRAFMGALKVRDDLEVVLDVRLPSG